MLPYNTGAGLATRNREIAELQSILATAEPFCALPADERRQLARTLRVESFGPGGVVFEEGQAASESWLVLAGQARIMAYYGNSRLMQIERLGRGQLLGLFCRYGADARVHESTAVAEGRLTAARIPDQAWESCMERFPEFSRRGFLACAARFNELRRLVVLDRESVERRVVRALLLLPRLEGGRVATTRQSLAVQTGAAVETVFRVLGRLRRRRWIDTERQMVVIKDPDAMAEMVRRAPSGRGRRAKRI